MFKNWEVLVWELVISPAILSLMTSPGKVDFSKLRRQMISSQLQERDIVDPRVLKVMGEVPREEFVSREYQDQAYEDHPLPIGQGQTISQPYIVALMTQLLQLKGQEKVLEVGTGSGYQAAVLAYLAQAVYTLEREPVLLERACLVFQKMELKKIQSKVGDGSKGWPKFAPFQTILVTAAAKEVPRKLTEQLADGGRLVIPVGDRFGQRLMRLTKKGDKLEEEDFGGVAFVPLR